MNLRPLTIPESLKADVANNVKEILPDAVRFRRERHQNPELTWKETQTAEAVARALREIPQMEITTGVGRLGVVGVLKGALPGPTVALRADMDALPIMEKTGASYTSKVDGAMHACGHDGHMANLMGSAKVLSKMQSQLRGTVKFVFQPAEEGGAGAREMADAGVLKAPTVAAIYGLHGWPELPAGTIGVKSGPLLAAHATVEVKVKGTGGHAAMPHLVTDQVLAAARFIEAIQSVRSRSFSPVEPMALTISAIHGGKACNVIPDEVQMLGTLRTVTPEGERLAMARIHEIAKGISIATGTTIAVEIQPAYPPTINHEKETAYLAEVAELVLGKDNVVQMPVPTMGAEDFSFFLQRAPGSFFFLGVSDGRAGGYPSLHDPRFDFNDRALETGIRIYCHLALSAADRLES